MERGEAGLHTQEQMLQLHSRDVTIGAPITSASLFQTPVQNNGAARPTALMELCVLFQSFNISFFTSTQQCFISLLCCLGIMTLHLI